MCRATSVVCDCDSKLTSVEVDCVSSALDAKRCSRRLIPDTYLPCADPLGNAHGSALVEINEALQANGALVLRDLAHSIQRLREIDCEIRSATVVACAGLTEVAQ